jgi:hypothetical protein
VLFLRQPQEPPVAPEEAPAAAREKRRPAVIGELAPAPTGDD